MRVLDASAVLAYLKAEQGAQVVDERLEGSIIGAANWAEVLARLGGDTEATLADAILAARGVRIEPVTKSDAACAARLVHGRPDLSLGDRLCLALGDRLGVEVLTADRAWGSSAEIVQIR